MKRILTGLAVVVVIALQAAAVVADAESYRLPEVRYADLLTLEPTVVADAARQLTELGALQITGIPRFGLARKRALEDLAECLESEEEVPEVQLPDGARRLSCGAASTGKKGIASMSSLCGDGAARLRNLVDAGMRQLFIALDSYAADHAAAGPLLDESYPTFSSLLEHGAHLEHLHAYVAPPTTATTTTGSSLKKEDAESPAVTLGMHVDAGLFIGMTTGLYSRAPLASAGLYMQLPGRMDQVQVDADDDSLIVLVGEGGASWLRPVLGSPLRAVPHALIAGFDTAADGTAATRSWYGKMILPPTDARVGPEQIPFARFRDAQAASSRPLSQHNGAAATESEGALWALLPSACGGASSGRVSVVADSCTADQVWCWAQCMDASTLDCSSDQYAACYDYQTQTVVSGNSMCMGGDDDTYNGIYCRPTCITNTSLVQTSSSAFCVGKGTTMFMQGFTSMKAPAGNDDNDVVDCVNLLFDSWTLDSRVKFGFACVGVFLLAALTQAVPLLRTACLRLPATSLWRSLALTVLFGVDKTVGYFVMLVAMTYSSELFAMICLGLTAGFVAFHLLSGAPEGAKWGDACCDDDAVWATTNPVRGGGPRASGKATGDGNCCSGTSEGI